jgi:hypothetical protein
MMMIKKQFVVSKSKKYVVDSKYKQPPMMSAIKGLDLVMNNQILSDQEKPFKVYTRFIQYRTDGGIVDIAERMHRTTTIDIHQLKKEAQHGINMVMLMYEHDEAIDDAEIYDDLDDYKQNSDPDMHDVQFMDVKFSAEVWIDSDNKGNLL